MNSILTIHNKGAQYHLLLPHDDAAKLCSMVYWAIEREGKPLVNDMGKLAMYLIEQACKVADARLIGGDHISKMVNSKVAAVFAIDRPERSVQLSMRKVFIEDGKPHLDPVFTGAFHDFKKYLHSILANKT